MGEPQFATRFKIAIHLVSAEEGGRTQTVRSGYRPLCVVRRQGRDETIGLCELDLVGELQPGTSGTAILGFAPEVTEHARSALTPGSKFDLAEGNRVIGSAEVIAIV